MDTTTFTGHTNTYHTYSFNEALRGIAAAGFTSAELTAVPGWADFVSAHASVADVKAQVASFGLSTRSVSTHVDLLDETSVTAAKAILDWSAEYGLEYVNFALASVGDAAHSRSNILAQLSTISDHASRVGVQGCIETHGDLAPNGRACAKLLDDADAQHLGINYDTGNVTYYSGVTAADDLPYAIDRVKHMHLKDKRGGRGTWSFPQLGTGDVEFRSIFQIVEENHAHMPMSVEIEFDGDPWPPLSTVDEAMLASLQYLGSI